MTQQAAFSIVGNAIEQGPIPGAIAALGTAEETNVQCFGLEMPGGAAVEQDTWYDLASLTKVLATATLTLQWIAEGRLDPAAPLREYLPETAWMQEPPSLADATILDLATHTSGLPAWEPLYTLGLPRATLFARVLHMRPVESRGRIVYSDFGFLILGHLLERLSGAPLSELTDDLFDRLGLGDDLRFGPVEGKGKVAATEECPWRGRLLRGEVHDENAFALGGVAGHAGLFGTVRGVTGFARALLAGRVHSPAVLAYLSQPLAIQQTSSLRRRGFGWALKSAGWSGGDLCGERTIGHAGFTGTGLWIDLERGRFSALLTNRVCPSRHTDTGIDRLRRTFNHAAFA